MEKAFYKIINDAKNFSFTKEEKDAVMKNVSIFIKQNPLDNPKENESKVDLYDEDVMNRRNHRHNIWGNISSKLFPVLLNLKKKKIMPTILILVLVLSGSVSLLANYTLPGDVLYPVKVNMNEKLQSWVAFSDDANIELHIRQAKERLDEVEKLKLRGVMSVETKTELKENFNGHKSEVERLLKVMNDRGEIGTALKANGDFESVLRSYNLVFSESSEELKPDLESALQVEANMKSNKENYYLQNNTGVDILSSSFDYKLD